MGCIYIFKHSAPVIVTRYEKSNEFFTGGIYDNNRVWAPDDRWCRSTTSSTRSWLPPSPCRGSGCVTPQCRCGWSPPRSTTSRRTCSSPARWPSGAPRCGPPTIPYLAGPAVELHGRRWIDGSVTEPLPVPRALADGATHVLALLNRTVSGLRRHEPSAGSARWTRALDRVTPGLGAIAQRSHRLAPVLQVRPTLRTRHGPGGTCSRSRPPRTPECAASRPTARGSSGRRGSATPRWPPASRRRSTGPRRDTG